MVNPRMEGMAHMRVPSSCCKGDFDNAISYHEDDNYDGDGPMMAHMRVPSSCCKGNDDDDDEYAIEKLWWP